MQILHYARHYPGEGPMHHLGSVTDDFGNEITIGERSWFAALHFVAQRVEG
jgi:hypothetical protein